MVRSGFFSGSADRDQRIAGNIGPSTPVKNYGGNMGFSEDFGAGRVTNVRPKKGFSLKDIYGDGTPRAQFFSPRSQEVGQIASATTDLSGLAPRGSDAYNREIQQYEQKVRDNYIDMIDRFGTDELRNLTEKGEENLRDSYDAYRDFRYQTNPGGYIQGQDFSQLRQPREENIFTKAAGSVFNRLTGTSAAAAGTLDGQPTRFAAQVSPTDRPKLDYVNPDRKVMNFSQVRDAFRPSNLFGINRNEIGGKLGTFDDPGSPLARDRQETIDRVKSNFYRKPAVDDRSISQIKADQDASMRERARLSNEAFKRGETPQMKSADDTYGTNMLSNPAFGFRDKMTDQVKAQYDRSAAIATERAKPDPSLGNVVTSAANLLKRQVNKITGETPLTKEKSLESIGERQLRLANKEINRPTYQKEAYARKFLGITNDQLKAQNIQRIRENAAARNQAFQTEKLQKAVDRAARRYGENTGSGRRGGFGSGTTGQGMSSNPAGMRQTGVGKSAGDLSRHSTGHSSTQPSRSGSSRRSGSSSRSSSSGSSSGSGSSGSSSGSGSTGGAGRTASSASRSRTGRSRSQCDIRTKIDIKKLSETNLVKDDLSELAFFVQSIK